MVNLENLLRDSLGWVVRGRQFVGGWQPLAEADTPLLGRGAILGENAMLGRRVWDAAAGISLALGPLPQQALPGLLPGGADLARLRWLVGRHVPSELQLSLELQPEPCPAQALPRLGAARLGWTSWLRPGLGRGEKRALPSIRLQLGSTSHPSERQPLHPRAVAPA
jgi:type VI secretion system protein ImpH